ncbi:MAG: Response regulator ArlR [Planctomycetota bacterium]
MTCPGDVLVGLAALMQPGILIVDEDRRFAEELTAALQSFGHSVHLETDGRCGLQAARALEPLLVILEINLRDGDGLQICRELKGDPRLSATPVVIVTTRTSEMDQIAGLSLGADDYVGKPVSLPLLMHRLQAILRRRDLAAEVPEQLNHLSIKMSRRFHSVTADGTLVDLTPTEFLLLWTMMTRPGRPFSRHELMEYARGQNTMALERTVDVHIKSMRKKLGEIGRIIETVRGVGYRIAQG